MEVYLFHIMRILEVGSMIAWAQPSYSLSLKCYFVPHNVQYVIEG